LHDEARSGRPPIDFLHIRILALLDEQSFHSAYSIAQALTISHSIILNHLRELFGMKNFHLRWIPHELTTRLQQIRMETFRELLTILKAHEKTKFQRFVTGNERWYTLEFHHSTKWSVS
jgi:DNA-binding transcriptional ArsR family regulator